MKFEVNTSNITFNGENLSQFFESFDQACKNYGIDYYVVGAFARDILLENIYEEPTGIATRDIDIAITISDWKKYQTFINHLVNHYNFQKSKNAHTFISPDNIFVDIIPYGQIEEERKISFPPNSDTIMNMLGFQEVYDATITIVLDKKVAIKLASMEGIALLKFIAWKDRIPDSISQKHVRDISLIIQAYFDAMVAEFASEFPDLFDEENFDTFVCGARVIGRRFNQMSNKAPILRNGLEDIFTYILQEEDNSLFLTQLTNNTNWNYPFCLRIISSLILGFRETIS